MERVTGIEPALSAWEQVDARGRCCIYGPQLIVSLYCTLSDPRFPSERARGGHRFHAVRLGRIGLAPGVDFGVRIALGLVARSIAAVVGQPDVPAKVRGWSRLLALLISRAE